MSEEFKCNLCGREYEHSTLWILEHLRFKNLYLCNECDLSMANQICYILYDLQVLK